MDIKILFFGKVREYIKLNEVDIILNDESNLNDLILKLNTYYSLLNNISNINYSINQEYVYDYNTILNDHDTIALIPPISGG